MSVKGQSEAGAIQIKMGTPSNSLYISTPKRPRIVCCCDPASRVLSTAPGHLAGQVPPQETEQTQSLGGRWL